MRKMIFVAASALAMAIPGAAFAQDTANEDDTAAETTSADTATAPDGTSAFGFEPYVAVMGGHAMFDRHTEGAGIPLKANGGKYSGTMVEGIVGANIPLGPVFVGVEGSAAKGIAGDIDWQYGVAGRAGFRAGDSGLVYGKYGREWVNFDDPTPDDSDYSDDVYGLGVEVGPKDIGLGGITGNSGVRLRLEANTHDFKSIRPMGGVVMHF